jgi:hypothetical protein
MHSELTKPTALSSPDSVLKQIEFARETKEITDNEEALWEGFVYRSNETDDSLDLVLPLDQEIAVVVSNSQAFETIIVTFENTERIWFEYGENAVPDSLGNVITTKNHPDEVWTVYRLLGEFLVINTDDETGVDSGFIVRQPFDLSFRSYTSGWQNAVAAYGVERQRLPFQSQTSASILVFAVNQRLAIPCGSSRSGATATPSFRLLRPPGWLQSLLQNCPPSKLFTAK